MSDGFQDAELQRMLDEQRTGEAAAERLRERSLLEQATQETRLAGVLASLGAEGWETGVWTRAGRAHHGAVASVGHDFCALSVVDGATYLPFRHIAYVRPAPGRAPRPMAHPDAVVAALRFDEVVRVIAEDRPSVVLGLTGSPAPLVGTLREVGADVLTLLLDDARAPLYAPLDSVVELSVRVSG